MLTARNRPHFRADAYRIFFLAGEGDFCYSAVHKLISRAIQVETNASGDSVAETEEATGTLRHESSTNVQMMI